MFIFSLSLDIIYQVFFWFLDSFNFANKFLDNSFTASITFIGFYFSIIPIKVFSSLFPNLYTFTSVFNYPISKSIWVFFIEQFIIVIFMTLTIFSIYIIIMWVKRFFNKFVLKIHQKQWSSYSKLMGILSLIFYTLIIISIIFI